MDAIPWYKSPVYVGAVVSIISQVLVLLGLGDKFAPEEIAKYVDAGFQILALAAVGYAAWKRQRSSVQPLTLTKAGAATKLGQVGFARPGLLALIACSLIAMVAMNGCPGFAPKPESFNEKMAWSIASVTFVRETATSFLAADKITADEAQTLQDRANNARTVLDAAERLLAIDFSGATAKLEVTRLLLQSLRDYLVCRETGNQNCGAIPAPT